MIRQIRTALDNSGNLNKGDLERFKAIFQRYLLGEIEIDIAYYDLLDNDLIPHAVLMRLVHEGREERR